MAIEHGVKPDIFKITFNPFNQESKEVIHEVGNIELCELLDVDSNHSVTCVCHTGTLALSSARAGTSCVKEERKIRNSSSTRWTTSRTPIRQEAWRQGMQHRQPTEKEVQEEMLPGYP